jgi:hypothetical protein
VQLLRIEDGFEVAGYVTASLQQLLEAIGHLETHHQLAGSESTASKVVSDSELNIPRGDNPQQLYQVGEATHVQWLWEDTGNRDDHAKFLANHQRAVNAILMMTYSTSNSGIQCGRCVERQRQAECEGSSELGCSPCARDDIPYCTRLTSFRLWNIMRTLDMTAGEVWHLVEKYIAKQGVRGADIGGGAGEGLRMTTGEVADNPGGAMMPPVGSEKITEDLRAVLREKDKEIDRLRGLLRAYGQLDALEKRIDETKGRLGYDQLKKANLALVEQGKEMKSLATEYANFTARITQTGTNRLVDYEMAITKLDEFIAFPHPERPSFENEEIRKIRQLFSAIWNFDRKQLAEWLPTDDHPIMSQGHRLGEGCSEYLLSLADSDALDE